jgi:hypothetical protein
MIRNIHLFLARDAIVFSIAMVVAIGTFLGTESSTYAQRFDVTDEQFDQWIYSGNRDNSGADVEISLAIEAVDRVCHLTQAQQDKLQLAGRGDFVRFQQRADELRAQYVGKTYDQNDIGKIFEKLQPLINSYRSGLLGRSSLFSKVVRRTLTPEQLQEYEEVEAERLKQRHDNKVRLFVAVFGQSCPLKDDQRSALVELLRTETRPPKRPSQYDWYIVLAQAAKIPEEKFAAILDPAQMRLLKKSLERGRGMAGFLKQQDILP